MTFIPPSDATVWIVCAACRHADGFIAVGARHFSPMMDKQIETACMMGKNRDEWEQGFLDQWERFYTREHAMDVVRWNGQHFCRERNGGSRAILYSEGIY